VTHFASPGPPGVPLDAQDRIRRPPGCVVVTVLFIRGRVNADVLGQFGRLA